MLLFCIYFHDPSDLEVSKCNQSRWPSHGACAHYVMVSKTQWKPFWLATNLYPLNDWAGWHFRVNYDVFAQAPLHWFPWSPRYEKRVYVLGVQCLQVVEYYEWQLLH